MTNKDAYLSARALWALRIARDELQWDDEPRAVALATGVLMGAGADAGRAHKIAAKVWRAHFETTDPV